MSNLLFPYITNYSMLQVDDLILFGLFFLLFATYSLFRGAPQVPLPYQVVFTPLILISLFFLSNGTGLIFNDDHPPFLFRLMQLREEFPSIPFFSPMWNGGYEAREFFPSGILNIFLPTAPLLLLFSPETIYTSLVVVIITVVPIAASYYSTTLLGGTHRAALFAAAIAPAPSLLWFRWGLKYGTLGFVTSAALTPVVLALICRAVDSRNNFDLSHAITALVVGTLMLFWTPSGLVVLPALLLSLLFIRNLFAKPLTLAAAAAILLVNAPWVILFLESSKVSTFISTEERNASAITHGSEISQPRRRGQAGQITKPLSAKRALRKARRAKRREKRLWREYKQELLEGPREAFFGASPLLLFGVVGLWCLRKRAPRSLLILGSSLAWLSLCGTFLAPLRPALELTRFFLTASLILIPLSGIGLNHLYSNATRSVFLKKISASFVLALLILPLLWAGRYLLNRTTERFAMASPEVARVTDAIKESHQPGTRVLFLGFVLHEFEGGHLAPLPGWTNLPMVASSYQHDKWEYTDVIPESFRARGEAGVIEFLDLFNAGTVIAHQEFWKAWLQERPHLFLKEWDGKDFSIYSRLAYKGDYFLVGEGEVLSQNMSSITVLPKSEQATLKFNYLPILRSSGCNLSGQKVGDGLTFVALSECEPEKPIVVEAIGPLQRLEEIVAPSARQ